MVSKPSGICTDDKLAQDEKAAFGMALSDDGNFTSFSVRQPSNAFSPMASTPSGMFKVLNPSHPSNLQLVVGQWIPVKMAEK